MLQRWLNAPGDLIKPPLPPQRGSLTIADLDSATSVDDYAAKVRDWAGSTWAAYASLHPRRKGLDRSGVRLAESGDHGELGIDGRQSESSKRLENGRPLWM